MARIRVQCLALCAALAAAAPSAAEMSESKQQLVREILELSAGRETPEQLVELYLAQLRGSFGALVDRIIDSESDLPPQQLEKLRKELADFERFAGNFRARFSQSIDLRAIRDQVYMPLYDRYFDEQELREIAAFYRTPTGRKAIQVMPQLLHEGAEATRPLLEPRVMALVGEILAQERQQILP
jgi:hypothetical protein